MTDPPATVLDVSDAALTETRQRLDNPPRVSWLRTDLLDWQPERTWSVWHDGAVFHFLTNPTDRTTYHQLLRQAVEPGGVIIVATSSLDGPEWCSGLPVHRYDAHALATKLGPDLAVVASGSTLHHTPTGTTQPFTWLALRR